MIKRLVVATRNEGKRREIEELLADLGVSVVSVADYPYAPEVDEPFDTFRENAAQKATVIGRTVGEWTVADDSGLVVDALGGAPGVQSSRIAPSDPERIAWVLAEMANVPADNRQARFVCCIALSSPEGIIDTWEETVEGTIALQPSGEQGFGFDPVFHYGPAGKTFAEMSRQEKGAVSHRGRALREFRRAFAEIVREQQG